MQNTLDSTFFNLNKQSQWLHVIIGDVIVIFIYSMLDDAKFWGKYYVLYVYKVKLSNIYVEMAVHLKN